MIYLVLRGRIGNQLFMYAYANALRKDPNELIIIDDSAVLKEKWINSLEHYNLRNVKFVHKKQIFSVFFKQLIIDVYHQKKILNMNYTEKFKYEIQKSNIYGRLGYIACENGYYDFNRVTENVLLDGYFQSEKYFVNNRDDILSQFSLEDRIDLINYPNLEELKTRNSVCISIKVEHNIGSSLYEVCTKEYWEKAIELITQKVDNPVFFICSDNVDYVLKYLIDTSKYDYLVQEKNVPVHISLAAMSFCKHFIIGNTSFGWWAQYMCKNSSKIVVAPSKWMNVEMPVDIYQDGWTLINV